jgi:hypothetical protein
MNGEIADVQYEMKMARRAGYTKSPARLRSEADQRSREREAAEIAHEKRWEYWTEPGGRRISFNRDNWSRAEIEAHKAKVRQEHKCRDVASSAPTSTPVARTPKKRKATNSRAMMLLLLAFVAMMGMIVLITVMAT